MSFLALLFIGGISLKGIIIFIQSWFDMLRLKYKPGIVSLATNLGQENSNPEKHVAMEIEARSNSLKPLGKQIYMRAAS